MASRRKIIDADRLTALLNDPVVVKVVTVLDVVSLSILELLEYGITRKDVSQSLANEIIEFDKSSLIYGDVSSNFPLIEQDIIARGDYYFYNFLNSKVSIVPGASQRESEFHYYSPALAVPVDTRVALFNNDLGQPHTVTSGLPAASDAGRIFNSGIMPATAPGVFMYTFDRAGAFAYHCIIHPWRVAAVSVNGGLAGGDNFELAYGTGPVWNLTQDSNAA